MWPVKNSFAAGAVFIGAVALGGNRNFMTTVPAFSCEDRSMSPSFFKKPTNPLALVLMLSAIFFVLFLVISGVVFMYRAPDGLPRMTAGGGRFLGMGLAGGSVGVVEINGPIMDSRKTLRRLERLEEDPAVKAVVVRLNSPGGAVAPSQEIYEAVRSFKKPVVASMGSVAASGAFYVAMGAKKVFANPGTITGSIGVIMQFANLEKLYEWAKIQRYVIKTGKFKDVGSEFRAMTPEEKGLLQQMIDNVLVQFKTAVVKGRGLKMDRVTAIADGRIFSGEQAYQSRLVDELGTLQDAIDEAGSLGGIKGKPHVVYADEGGRKWLDLLLDNGADEDSRSALGGMVRRWIGVEGIDPVSGLNPGVYWIWNGSN